MFYTFNIYTAFPGMQSLCKLREDHTLFCSVLPRVVTFENRVTNSNAICGFLSCQYNIHVLGFLSSS